MFDFCMQDGKYPHIHFIGIGGISMSGLAEILITEGYKITGSDSKDSPIINRLKDLGAEIYISHNGDNINGADLVIYTDAISKDNQELIKALESGVPVIDRASFLGALMKNYGNSIAVSGTHGKTTTTSMLTTILNNSPLDPTILLGGELEEIGGNVKLGSKDLILTEACEYKGNILKYFPTMAVILNIDEDHLDFFDGLDHILSTFVEYGKNLKEDSYLLINSDDISSGEVIKHTRARVITFGIESDCDYRAENIVFSPEGYPSYDLRLRNGEVYRVKLNVMGTHNIYNSLASITASHVYNLPMNYILEKISKYTGVHRRLEFKGYYNGIKIIDDYAHHPTEIQATLNAIKNGSKGNIYCVFQPHTYTRTKLLLNKFAESFFGADKIIITDIYAAREVDNQMVHSRQLVDQVINNGLDAIYLSSFEEVEEFLLGEAKENDIIITMGAGNIYQVGELILNKNNNEKEAV